MPDVIEGLIISSTTDSQEQVNEAVGIKPKEAESSDAEESAAVETVPDTDAGKTENEEGQKKSTGKGVAPKVSLAEYNKLARQRMEEKWEKEKLAKELAELRAEKASTPAEPEKDREEDEEVEPDPAKYTDTKKLLLDHYKWARRQEAKEDARIRFEAEQAQVEADYNSKRDEAKKRYPDWEERAKEAVETMGEKSLESPAFPTIRKLPNGPDVAYYLFTHLDEAKEISEMPPDLAIAEVGAISRELALKNSSHSPKPIRTNAPRPITTVGGSTKRTASIDDPDISTEEYVEIRKAQRRGR